MNQKPVGARAYRRNAYREQVAQELGRPSAENHAMWKAIRAELSQTRREAKLPIQPNLPDLWTYDTEQLLHELDGIREMILRIPATLDTRSALQSAIDRIWRVEQDVRFLLLLKHKGQTAFAQKAEALTPKSRNSTARPDQKIVKIRA
jgi:hypothetical protein